MILKLNTQVKCKTEGNRMGYQIIVDSCVDFDDQLPCQNVEIVLVPFKIIIDGEEIIDNCFDTSSFVSKLKAGIGKFLTACPSPYDFYSAFKKNAFNFVVTISSKVSGSYQLLHIIPIIGSSENGEIVLKGRAIGKKQAVERLMAIIALSATDMKNSILAITYVDNKEEAENIRKIIQNRLYFKEVGIFRAGALSSVYVNRGGLVFAF